MSKFVPLTIALTVMLPALALASTLSLDTSGDGVLSIDEIQVAMPEVTEDLFAAMDLNADGALDADEVTAAEEAGLIAPTEG